jgi:DNA uptake protein ComE-like DNA-binding protein
LDAGTSWLASVNLSNARNGEDTMGSARYLAIVVLTTLVAMPVVAQTQSPSKSPPTATTGPGKAGQPSTSTGSQAQGGLVDINSASAEELDKLPGVGPARVKAIIANRPYNGKDDLTQRKIIPPNVYSQIKDKIIARQGPPKQ